MTTAATKLLWWSHNNYHSHNKIALMKLWSLPLLQQNYFHEVVIMTTAATKLLWWSHNNYHSHNEITLMKLWSLPLPQQNYFNEVIIMTTAATKLLWWSHNYYHSHNKITLKSITIIGYSCVVPLWDSPLAVFFLKSFWKIWKKSIMHNWNNIAPSLLFYVVICWAFFLCWQQSDKPWVH